MSAQPRREELALPRRREEAAVRERQIRRRHVEPHPAALQQRLERHARQLRRSSNRARGESRVRSSSRNDGWSRPMRAASRRKISLLGSASPNGSIDGRLSVDVVMAVREMQVPVLELRRRRQHDVRVVGGVGLEVLEHDGEQIVARASREHGVAIRRNGRGIRVVHDQRAHRRAADAGVVRRQRLAEANHVDRAHGRRQIGAFARAAVLNAKFALDDSCTPPPVRRQCPVSAGRQAMVRTAMPPPACRCSP